MSVSCLWVVRKKMNFESSCKAVRLLVTQILCVLGIDRQKKIENGIKECNKLLRRLYAAGKKPIHDFHFARHIQTSISLVKSYKRQLMNAKKFSGGNISTKKQENNKSVKWVELKSAFQSRVISASIVNIKHTQVEAFLDDCRALLKRRTTKILAEHKNVKINTTLAGEFIIMKDSVEISDVKFMATKNALLDRHTKFDEWYDENIKRPILTKLEEFEESQSGWALKSIINLEIGINKFSHYKFGGSSYLKLPKQIQSKKACVNVKNTDEACFGWSVVSALFPTEKNSDRVSSYPHFSSILNLKGISFPMTVSQVTRFEKQNDISINIFTLTLKNGRFFVESCYVTKNKQAKHVNLLMIQNDYSGNNNQYNKLKFHFVWIKNLIRLVGTQLNKSHVKKFICDRCLNYFHSKQTLEKHELYCGSINDCKVTLPTPDKNVLTFKNYRHKEFAPFVIYADLECLLVPTGNKVEYQSHVPCKLAYFVKCSYDDTLSYYKSHTGLDCTEWFAEELAQFAEDVDTVFQCPLPMDTLTLEQRKEINKATHCHICEKTIHDRGAVHLDHCHLTGRVRGLAHKSCNVNYKDDKTIPVIFHGLSNYDLYMIFISIAEKIPGETDVIPCNKQKFISFTKKVANNFINFRFIDSYRFLDASLADLAANLDDFPIMRRFFEMPQGRMSDDMAYDYVFTDEIPEYKLRLISKKCQYPYGYFTDLNKFNDTKLPPMDSFYNSLEEAEISDDDYLHAQMVWHTFECRNLGDYADVYLAVDVFLLAEVFERFRKVSLSSYDLDPAHYFTLPGYTWDCMLKYTNVDLELLTDVDMVIFIERALRGGFCQCTKRYARANNRYLSDYDPNKEISYLMYFDINAMYSHAMTNSLPYGEFNWLDEQEISRLDPTLFDETSTVGYFLEVDIIYPQRLHNDHCDLPFLPEHRSVNNSKQTKLMATLYNKEKYVVHYLNLKQAIEHGLELRKIHRVLKYKQSPWLRGYIELNNKFRTLAKTEFEKNLFKLMNNAVFGKSMENVRNRVNVKLINRWEGKYGMESRIADPRFKSSMILSENSVLVELRKTEVVLNKPIYVGASILETSKLLLYNFHYDYMKVKLGNEVSICYGDTDSFIYHIKNKDIYQLIKADCMERFDTSGYPQNNMWNIPQVNKKVLGMMKDENNGDPMKRFIGLRSKMYATDVEKKNDQGVVQPSITKKVKGVRKYVIKKKIQFNDFVTCLQNFTGITIDSSLLDDTQKNMIVKQNLIRPKNHKVFTVCMEKLALSPEDDKRYLIPNSFKTLPWGHCDIN